MKCPQMSEAVTSGYGERRFQVRECLEAECAWWCVAHKECSIVSIALNLKDVEGAVQSVANYLRQ